MTDTTADRTLDWTQYWTAPDAPAPAESPAAEHVVDPLLAFLAAENTPDSYADVGCGPGAVPFAVAERYPDATVAGYDAAEPVLAANRERARDRGLDVAFEHCVLPGFDPGTAFDAVSAFFTLCYVPDVDRALRALYDAVAPGGHLVFTYHNRYAQSLFRTFAEDPHEYLDGDGGWDPETFPERFELVLEGENLLSYDRIQSVLGTRPRSVWSAADVDRYGAWRQTPLVYVPKT